MAFPTFLRSNEIRKWGSATFRQRGLKRVPEHPLDAAETFGRDGWPWGGGGGGFPKRAERLRGDSYVRRPRVGCPVVPATGSR